MHQVEKLQSSEEAAVHNWFLINSDVLLFLHNQMPEHTRPEQIETATKRISRKKDYNLPDPDLMMPLHT